MKILLILLLILSVSLSGCLSSGRKETEDPEPIPVPDDPQNEPEKALLLDFFDRTVGTPMEMPYYELVIYDDGSEEGLLLEQYTSGGTSSEKVRGFRIPGDAYDEIMQIVNYHDMQHWNDGQGVAVTGRLLVVKFMLDGRTYRVSSDNMPEDGMGAMEAVGSAIASYMDDDSLIYDRYTGTPPTDDRPEPVADKDELLGYMVTTELTKKNVNIYFQFTSGMGPQDIRGNITNDVNYYLLLYLKEEVLPGSDLKLDLKFTEVTRESKMKRELATDSSLVWAYSRSDKKLISRPLEQQEFATFRDFSITGFSGSVVWFDIPKEKLMEDEFGRYFYYENRNTRYYLKGFSMFEAGSYSPNGSGMGIGIGMMGSMSSGSPDYNDLWYKDIIG